MDDVRVALSSFPLCAWCRNPLYVIENPVLLPCHHGIACFPCCRQGLLCPVCKIDCSGTPCDQTLAEYRREANELFMGCSQAGALHQVKIKICEYFRSVSSCRINGSGTAAPLVQEVQMQDGIPSPPPLREIPSDSPKLDFYSQQCLGCYKDIPMGSFRCECGVVNFGLYIIQNPQVLANSHEAVRRIFATVGVHLSSNST